MTLGVWSIAVACVCLAGGAIAQTQAGSPRRPGENIALGRPYTLAPAPNYALCTDPGDALQLTDGAYTEGHFWTQQSAVGWQGAKPVLITIDLGMDQPICGASFSTAAGIAGVTWPDAIEVYVSDDAKAWYRAGELIGLGAKRGLPPAEGYAVHRYWTGDMACHGRFVCLVVATSGPYLFCDEIEVYRGADTLLAQARAGSPVSDLCTAFLADAASSAVRLGIVADIDDIGAQVKAAKLSGDAREAMLQDLDDARIEVAAVRFAADARAIAPYNAVHERVLRVRAALWRALGLKSSVWGSDAWYPLQAGDVPPAPAHRAAVEMVMLRNEVRGAVINITNTAEREQRIALRWRGRGGTPKWLTVHEVAWTGVAGGRPTASALPEAPRNAGGWEVRVPSGMTRQVWLSIDSAGLQAGKINGSLSLAGEGLAASVPVTIKIASVAMPSRLSLSLGGWDYTQSPTYGVNDANVDNFVAFLRKYHVDAPWAQSHVMPFGTHDASGKMTSPPDTSLMDRWLERWKGSRFYFVFAAFAPPGPDTPTERRRIADWITFWAGHVAKRGVKPSQLGLLLFDEPREPLHDSTIVRYATVIRQAQPDVLVFEDPIWPDPRQTTREMLDATHIVCPNRPMWLENRSAYEQVFLPLQRTGKALAFYSCSGPVRKLDPYSYHRLQAWDAFRYGAVHMAYWAFGDTGGGSSWNEFAAQGTGFCPQFLGPDGCTTSKHMEAIREGLYDYETLTLLRAAVLSAERAKRAPAAVAPARRLLSDGPKLVTEAQGARSIWWADAKDRGLADKVRVDAIGLLEKLAGRR